MKKDILALLSLALIIVVLIHGTNIQSVDEYYLTHIDDITPQSETVFISIRCDTVLQNYDELDKVLQSDKYVPQNGVILPETEYVLRPGDTVFDILDRAVQGINYLYEFSCGPLSGWMYQVNGEFPNYGCSKYKLKDGDRIAWVYTCDLGKDVGCIWMGDETG